MTQTLDTKFIVVSRDPVVIRGLVQPLKAKGFAVRLWDAGGYDTNGRSDAVDGILILGVNDLSRLSVRNTEALQEARLVVGAPPHKIGLALMELGRFGRPHYGDAVVTLDSRGFDLLAVLTLAWEGYLAFPAEVVTPFLLDASLRRNFALLSTEERKLLALLAEGRRNTAIGAKLGWPESQVKTRLRAVMRKLQLPNRTAAAVAAYRFGVNNDTARHSSLGGNG